MNNRIYTFSVFLSIFLSSYIFFSHPFEGYFHYLIFLFLLPIFFVKYGLPVAPLKILLLPLFFGTIQLYEGNNTIELFLKIFLGVLVTVSFYYYVMISFEFDVERLFKLYLKGALIVTFIGYFQLFSFYVIHFERGYDFSWILNKGGLTIDKYGNFRIYSIFTEASQFCVVLSPALFVAIHNLLLKKEVYLKRYQSILIIIAVIQSTSSLGLISIFIVIALLTINHGKFINFLVTVVALFIIARVFYTFLPGFRSRTDSALGLWVDTEYTLDNVNNSSFILYNNWHVALENFKNHPFFGTGLGSHPIAFDKYSLTLIKGMLQINFNKADANSMFLRLLSETGLMGVIFMFYVMFKFFVRRDFNTPENNHWLISNAILVLIILYLIRQGNYFLNGFPFFMWMYYYTKKTNQIEPIQNEEMEIINSNIENRPIDH